MRPPSGALAIITTTGGESLDPNGYTVTIAGSATGSAHVPTNGTAYVTGLSAGTVSLTLGDVASTCQPNGGPTMTATVVAGDTTSAAFTIACHTPPGAATAR